MKTIVVFFCFLKTTAAFDLKVVDADIKLSLFIIIYLNGDPALNLTNLRKGQILFHRIFMGNCNNDEYFENYFSL